MSASKIRGSAAVGELSCCALSAVDRGGRRRSHGADGMFLHLPPLDILFALLQTTILLALAAGVDLPAEDRDE
jgi:hypothetical protein